MKNQILTLIVVTTALVASPAFAMEESETNDLSTRGTFSPTVEANEALEEQGRKIDAKIARLNAEKGQFKRMGAIGDAKDHSQKIRELENAKIDIEIALLEKNLDFFVRKGAENDACKCQIEIQKKRRAKSLLQ